MDFRGVYANLPTPFDASGDRIDVVRLQSLVEYVISRGVDGVACLLSSGEYAFLDSTERRTVAESVVGAAGGRVPVLVGVSHVSTRKAVHFAQHAEQAGASAVMVMPVQYWPLLEAEVLDHFRAVAAAVRLPIGVYDNPSLGAAPLTAATYATLTKEANVQLSKDSSGRIGHVMDVTAATQGRVDVLHGTSTEMLPALLAGASGLCTALAAVFPAACASLYRAVALGDWETGRAVFSDLWPLASFLQRHRLVRGVKAASALLGRPLGPVRRPLHDLDSADLAALAALLGTHQQSVDGAGLPARRPQLDPFARGARA